MFTPGVKLEWFVYTVCPHVIDQGWMKVKWLARFPFIRSLDRGRNYLVPLT